MFAERQTTTSLIEIRDFLMTDGVAPAPWQPPTKSVEALFGQLRDKQRDDRYWARLKTLTRRMEGHQFSLSAASNFEALGRPTIDDVIDDLRRSLGDARQNGEQSFRGWLNRSLSTTALAGFFLLGVCAGCDDDDADENSDPDCDEAVEEGLGGERAEIYCELVDLVQEDVIPIYVRGDLLECLPRLDSAYREKIIDNFDTMDDDELAEFLEEVTWGGPGASEEDRH